MNKLAIMTGLIAGVVITGLILGPLIAGLSNLAFSASVGHMAMPMPTTGKHKHITFIANEKVVQVAPDNILHPGGIKYNAMVFNGTLPAPVIALDVGDNVSLTLKNEGKTIHSMDFHAGMGAKEANSGPVKPGESKTWSLVADHAGVFFYHCSADALNGIWEHIANGMYGGIIVHPPIQAPVKEFYMVFGEIYNSADKGLFKGTNGTVGLLDMDKFLDARPDLVLTNGMAHKYVPSIGGVAKIELNKNATVFKVKPGENTRWYVVNGGPNNGVAFHPIGAMLDVHQGYNNSRLGTQEVQAQTYWIPPGSGAVLDINFPTPGLYVGVDHSMRNALKGAAFAVLATNNSTEFDQPPGTWVPPKGSNFVTDTPQARIQTEKMMKNTTSMVK